MTVNGKSTKRWPEPNELSAIDPHINAHAQMDTPESTGLWPPEIPPGLCCVPPRAAITTAFPFSFSNTPAIGAAINLRQLEMALAVAEVGSHSKAGERLHISYSAIHRQVRLLKYEIGDRLLARV